ncbi:MAG: ester cyclase [Deltaproteobacteria bacterium]|nr:MAG: ester cyclase [Deltaproteobacteria bacterium]
MKRVLGLGAAVLSVTLLSSCRDAAGKGSPDKVAQHLATFDDLDFNVYTHQKWDELGKSHAKDIVVHYPDGHTTKGLPDHIAELKGMWVFAPDNRIVEHPIKFGHGDYTAVTGFLLGTFTQPMPIGNGKTISPTGKAYKLPMATIGHWNNEGTMDEEYLYWDNAAFMKMIGVGN